MSNVEMWNVCLSVRGRREAMLAYDIPYPRLLRSLSLSLFLWKDEGGEKRDHWLRVVHIKTNAAGLVCIIQLSLLHFRRLSSHSS